MLASADMESRLIQVEGVALHVGVTGQGSDLVVLTGGPGCVQYLERDEISPPAHRAWYPEPRGVGRSGGGPHTMERAIADLEGIREVVGVGSWMVMGHSWGCDLAVRYAVEHPESVTAGLAWVHLRTCSRRDGTSNGRAPTGSGSAVVGSSRFGLSRTAAYCSTSSRPFPRRQPHSRRVARTSACANFIPWCGASSPQILAGSGGGAGQRVESNTCSNRQRSLPAASGIPRFVVSTVPSWPSGARCWPATSTRPAMSVDWS